MKKKSILVLLLVCMLSLAVGLFGCDSVTKPVTSESESVSVEESESVSVEESESVTEPEEIIDSAIYSDIITANALETVLKGFSTYHVSYYFEDGALSGHNADYYYSKDDQTDEHYAFYQLENGDGEVVSGTAIMDGLRYVLDLDGEYSFIISPPNHDSNVSVFNFGCIDLTGFTLKGDVLKRGSNIELLLEGGTNELGFVTVFDFILDKDTLLFRSAERRIENQSGEYLEVAQISFEYDCDHDAPTAVVDYIIPQDGDEDAISFILEYVSEDTDSELKTAYSVKKGVNILMDADSEGNTYTFYKNYSCTKDIEDLDEILVYYNGATVYVTQTKAQFSFDFTLTEDDIELMNSYIAEYLELAQTDADFEVIDDKRAPVEDMMGYFVHQYYMGQIQYYMDISKQSGKDAFNFAQETYNEMYDAYISMYRTVYEMTDNAYSEWMFEDWTEEDLAILYQDNEAISELETANTQLEQQFNELANDENWSYNVEVLYEQIVANNQKLAELHGYDNAYDYMATESYHRNYSEEERAAFFANVKKYVYGFYNKAMANWNSVNAGIDTDLYQRYNLVANKSTKSLKNEYLSGYINSYNNSLNQKMKNMYEKKAVKFAISSKSMGTAYVNYSSYYEEGFAFFGSGYQDLLTVVHEMGHYVANSSYSLSSMGYDLAETQSQGNEWMMLYYLKDEIDSDVHEVMYSLRLVNSMYIVLYASIVDEFEYRVYNAETPYVAGEFKGVLEGVLEDLGIGANKVDEFYSYIQQVSLTSPVYYINYATSELTSIGFYTMAAEEGYEVAQEAYRKLQEDCDTSLPYAQIIAELGLRGPFEESTFRSIDQVFFA